MSIISAEMAHQNEILNGLQKRQNHHFITKFLTTICGVKIELLSNFTL
jgi:hypothetical protein